MTLLEYILKDAAAPPPAAPVAPAAVPTAQPAVSHPTVNQPPITAGATAQPVDYGSKSLDDGLASYIMSPMGPSTLYKGMNLPQEQVAQMQAAEAEQQAELAKHAPKAPPAPKEAPVSRDQAIVDSSLAMIVSKVKAAAVLRNLDPSQTATGGHNAGILNLNPKTGLPTNRDEPSGYHGFKPTPPANIVPESWAFADKINPFYQKFLRGPLLSTLLKGQNRPQIMTEMAMTPWRAISANYMAGAPTEAAAASNPWINALARAAGTAVNQWGHGNFDTDQWGRVLQDTARGIGVPQSWT